MSETLAKQAADFYDIGAVASCAPNTRGLSNVTFEINNAYFLTIFKERTGQELEIIAQAAHAIDERVPLARPVEGATGYCVELDNKPVLLTPKLPGRHYVGSAQSDKVAIPLGLHSSLATVFWDLHKELGDLPTHLKKNISPWSFDLPMPDDNALPEHIKRITDYAPCGYDPDKLPSYPAIIHDDMERQNILSRGNKVTGIVDLDAILKGDLLYEFGHFVFNIALCDPSATPQTPAVYFTKMQQAGMIADQDVPKIYDTIYRFAVNDMIQIEHLTSSLSPSDKRHIKPGVLEAQYGRGLSLAQKFFRDHYPA